MTEEERAALYRTQCAARLQATTARLAALKGSDTARVALEEQWAPLRDWLRERRNYPPAPDPGSLYA